jgi:hypothetical protein
LFCEKKQSNKKKIFFFILRSNSHHNLPNVVSVHYRNKSLGPVLHAVEIRLMRLNLLLYDPDFFFTKQTSFLSFFFLPSGHFGQKCLCHQIRSRKKPFDSLTSVNHGSNVEMIWRICAVWLVVLRDCSTNSHTAPALQTLKSCVEVIPSNVF